MRPLLIAALIAPLVIAAPLPVLAQAPAQPILADGQTLLHLADSAQRIVRQDRLTAQLRAEVTGPDAARVQAEINRRMTSALDRARAVAGVRSETRGYYVSQETPNSGPARWRGVQTLVLIGADSGAILALAGELQQAPQGGLIMSDLSYDLAPETARAAEDELTAEALKRLRERADRVAAGMGAAVRGFRDLRVGNVDGGRGPRPVMMRAAMAAQAAPPPTAEPGETTLQVSVDADILIGPPRP